MDSRNNCDGPCSRCCQMIMFKTAVTESQTHSTAVSVSQCQYSPVPRFPNPIIWRNPDDNVFSYHSICLLLFCMPNCGSGQKLCRDVRKSYANSSDRHCCYKWFVVLWVAEIIDGSYLELCVVVIPLLKNSSLIRHSFQKNAKIDGRSKIIGW